MDPKTWKHHSTNSYRNVSFFFIAQLTNNTICDLRNLQAQPRVLRLPESTAPMTGGLDDLHNYLSTVIKINISSTEHRQVTTSVTWEREYVSDKMSMMHCN